MKKITMFILIMVVVFMTGCDLPAYDEKTVSDDENVRMVQISVEKNGYIVFDVETGVQYWRSNGSYTRGNLTMLVDAEGKPLIYEGWEEYKK